MILELNSRYFIESFLPLGIESTISSFMFKLFQVLLQSSTCCDRVIISAFVALSMHSSPLFVKYASIFKHAYDTYASVKHPV